MANTGVGVCGMSDKNLEVWDKSYHSQSTNEFSQEVVLVELRGTLVLVKHGEAKLLDLFKVVVHLKLHPKHWVEIVHCSFSASQLKSR